MRRRIKPTVCPYKSIAGSFCCHRYANKVDRKNEKNRTVCRYSDNPKKCQLYNLWVEQTNKS